MTMDTTPQTPASLSLGELSQAVDQGGVTEQQQQQTPQEQAAVAEEPRRKRRHHRHRRRHRTKGDSNWKLSQQAKAWVVIIAATATLCGVGLWVFFLFRENDMLRTRLSLETFANKERIAQIETKMQSTKFKEAAIVQLEHEKFNSTEPMKSTHVKKPASGVIVLNLHLPTAIQTDRWDLVLRDRLQNSRARLTVGRQQDGTLTVALTELDHNTYEIHLKARGSDPIYRYMFSVN